MVDQEAIRAYWERDDAQSMYDKHLLSAEIRLVTARLPANGKILDVGCGEGEGTLAYSFVPGVTIHAIDFSQTRLRQAGDRLAERSNVILKQVDVLGEYTLDSDYDAIITQRCLVNLPSWELQRKVLHNLGRLLKPVGTFIMLEGSRQGAESLNEFRALFRLDPIPVQWHNLFLDDDELLSFMKGIGWSLVEQDGLGSYFLLTRGIRPYFDTVLNWDCEFNRVAASDRARELLGDNTRFSRLKLWVFRRTT